MTASWDWVFLVRSEGPKLMRFLRRFGPGVPAEDVVQESFARLHAAGAENLVSPRAFLFRTARNLAIDTARRLRRTPERPASAWDLEAASTDLNPEDARIALDEARALGDALASLPDLERRALMMRRVEGAPLGEVAAALGVSERQVQRLVLRAIAHLYSRMTGDNPRSKR